MENSHVRCQHTTSTDFMIWTLLEKFPIIGLTKAVKDIMKNCLICRKRMAKKTPDLMAPLKKNVAENRPFTETGIDYTGPFSINVRKQMFDLFLTCRTTGCVHFEVCKDQKTSSVLSTLIRFLALRGAPSVIQSDNQANFIATKEEFMELTTLLGRGEIQKGLTMKFDKGTQCEFIPPRAPRFGSFWEIMVRAMKRAVKTLTAGREVSEDQFPTAISLAASLLNFRPLSRKLTGEKETIITPYSIVGEYFAIDGGDNMTPLLRQFVYMFLDIDRDL